MEMYSTELQLFKDLTLTNSGRQVDGYLLLLAPFEQLNIISLTLSFLSLTAWFEYGIV